MSDHTPIEWTDETWNVITGCELKSEGCRYCYAARLAATRMKNHTSRKGLARMNAAGDAKFTGEVRFNEQWLDQPLRWDKARMIFAVAHGDLFYEKVPFEWIDRVFAVMALTPRHTYQVLTKRPDRLREYLSDPDTIRRVYTLACEMAVEGNLPVILIAQGIDPDAAPPGERIFLDRWPLPNVWIGVSVENQATADERIPVLLDAPGALHWISAEPLLGPIDLTAIPLDGDEAPVVGERKPLGAFTAAEAIAHLKGHTQSTMTMNVLGGKVERLLGLPVLGWVVAGGESGAKARFVHPDLPRALRDQCAAAGVPFLLKQWGEWLPVGQHLPGRGKIHGATAVRTGRMKLHYGGTPTEHPKHAYAERGVRFAVMPDGALAFRVGKKAAGRLLDGVLHDGFPETRHG